MQRLKPGPLCSKKGRVRERGRRSDRRDAQRSSPVSSDNEGEKDGRHDGKGSGEKDEVEKKERASPPLTISSEIANIFEDVKETQRRTRARSALPALNRPRISSITTLSGAHKVRLVSPGVKRTREKDDEKEDGEVVVKGEESGPESVRSWTSSPTPSRDGKKFRRDPRDRKALTPGHEGQYTKGALGKGRAKEKERKERMIDELAEEALDPTIKASSVRSELVDRRALQILGNLREAPLPEITDRCFQEVEVIKKIAATSKNIKGNLLGALWRAAEGLTAVNLAYAERLREAREGAGKEKYEKQERFRTEIASLRSENALLRGQLQDMRAHVAKGKEAPLLSRLRRGPSRLLRWRG